MDTDCIIKNASLSKVVYHRRGLGAAFQHANSTISGSFILEEVANNLFGHRKIKIAKSQGKFEKEIVEVAKRALTISTCGDNVLMLAVKSAGATR